MNQQFISDVITSVFLAAIVSVAVQTIKERLSAYGYEFSGTKWMLITLLANVIVVFGYTLYYEHLALSNAIAIFVITLLGSQAIYQVILDKDKVLILEEKEIEVDE